MASETLEKIWIILKEYNFQIDTTTKLEIICTNCQNIMIKPYNVPCGCRYCYDCLIHYLNGEEKFCLGQSEHCKSESIKIDTNVFIDQPTNIKISRFIVKCPLHSCESSIELGKMTDHIRTCNRKPVKCPYYTIGCHEDKICLDKIKQHLEQENYSHTKLLMDLVDNWRNETLLKTNMLHLQEENKCTNEQMKWKQETVLTLEKNAANLSKGINLGTEKIYQSNQIEEIISALKTESEDRVEKVQQKCDLLEKNKENMEIKIVNLFQENKSLRKELETVKQNMTNQLCKAFEMFKAQLKTTIDEMSSANNTITTKLKQTEHAMKMLQTKVTQIEANSNCGEFLWCIMNWDEKVRRARIGIEKCIYSDPFYSHKNGYKMRLELHPNGFDRGRTTYLALYVCIVMGEFDNILQWPFRHEVQLELLNQETGLPHIGINVSYNDDPTSSTWKKPISETNQGFGYHDFVQLSELMRNTSLLQSNQIWIKATTQMKL